MVRIVIMLGIVGEFYELFGIGLYGCYFDNIGVVLVWEGKCFKRIDLNEGVGFVVVVRDGSVYNEMGFGCLSS